MYTRTRVYEVNSKKIRSHYYENQCLPNTAQFFILFLGPDVT